MLLEQFQTSPAIFCDHGSMAITFHRIFEQATLNWIVINNENLRDHLGLPVSGLWTHFMQALWCDICTKGLNIQF
ncbi:hypothetical protein D3C80_1665960 [compost metagenome]